MASEIGTVNMRRPKNRLNIPRSIILHPIEHRHRIESACLEKRTYGAAEFPDGQ